MNGSQKYKSTLDEPTMRLLVFLHGTVIMHASATGRTREERVAQVRIAADPTLHDYAEYVPVDNAVAKLWRWREQGVRIDCLSSHQNSHDVAKDDWGCRTTASRPAVYSPAPMARVMGRSPRARCLTSSS